jgi:type I restriction-modification system specificity determinant
MTTNHFQTAFLRFVPFNQLDKWYVSYYINPHKIQSQFELVSLDKILSPLKQKISKKNFKKNFDIVAKISFADGKIHLRPERETGMDLYFVPKNTLLVSKINFHQGALAINEIADLVCSTHYQPYEIINPNVYLPYLVLALRAKKFQDFLAYLRADGIKNEATFEFIKQLQIPLPDINTQKALVQAYQDKMAKADDLEKQANQNFSGCLDEILGIDSKKTEYPKSKLIFVHSKDIDKWGVHQILNPDTDFSNLYPIKTIQELCKVGSGGTPSRSQSEYYQGSIPWVKTGEVINDIILDTEEHISEQAIADSSAKLYPAGSLIIAMYGQGLTRGRTAKLGVDATTNQACAVLSEIKSDEILTDYLWVYLMNEYDRLRALASGNNQPNLNGDMIKNYPVVIPDLETQTQIANHIQAQKQQKKNKLTAAAYRTEALIEFERAIFQ